jgi:hypothetical protein
MPNGSLGMDHRAIVWCHGLLHVVRRVIWTLSISEEENVGERLKQVQHILGQEDQEAYQEHLQDMGHTFRVSTCSFVLFRFVCWKMDKHYWWEVPRQDTTKLGPLPTLPLFCSILRYLSVIGKQYASSRP